MSLRNVTLRLHVSLSISKTQSVIDQVADRELELGVVGARNRARALAFEPLFRDEIVLAVAAGHGFAGRTIDVDELEPETLLDMQEGAGVRQVVEEELRRAGLRLRPRARLEVGLQESVKSAVLAGYGVGFISRTAVEEELAVGTLAMARVTGLAPARQVYLVRAANRVPTRAAEAFVVFAKDRLEVMESGAHSSLGRLAASAGLPLRRRRSRRTSCVARILAARSRDEVPHSPNHWIRSATGDQDERGHGSPREHDHSRSRRETEHRSRCDVAGVVQTEEDPAQRDQQSGGEKHDPCASAEEEHRKRDGERRGCMIAWEGRVGRRSGQEDRLHRMSSEGSGSIPEMTDDLADQ